MTPTRIHRCPECGEDLKDGYLAYGSGLMWHEFELRGWPRMFPYPLATGHFVLGSWASPGLITSTPARKCSACGTVILPRAARSGRS